MIHAPFRPRGAMFLLRPAIAELRNRMRADRLGFFLRCAQAIVLATLIWILIASPVLRALRAFQVHPEIAGLLTRKMLSVGLVAGFALTVISCTISALGILFGDRDLRFLLVAPVDWLQRYLAQGIRVALHGGWAPVLVFTPVLYAVGKIAGGGVAFVSVAILGGALNLVTAAALATILAMTLTMVGGVRRSRTVIALVSLLGLILAVIMFRRIALIAAVATRGSALPLVDVLARPTAPFLPAEWLAGALLSASRGIDWLSLGAMFGAAAIAVTLAAALYSLGFTRALLAAASGSRQGAAGVPVFPGPFRVLERRVGPLGFQAFVKEVLRVRRDAAGWSQVFLALFGVGLYLYYTATLPLQPGDAVTQVFRHVLSLLNLGMASLLFVSLGVNFVLPLVSMEIEGLWLLRVAPISARPLVFGKLATGFLLLVPAAGITVGGAGIILQLSVPHAIVSTLAAVSCAAACSALALWLGARFPVWTARSSAEIASSLGGTCYSLSAVGLAILVTFLQSPFALSAWGGEVRIPALMVFAGTSPFTRLLLAGLSILIPATIAVFAIRGAIRALDRTLAQPMSPIPR